MRLKAHVSLWIRVRQGKLTPCKFGVHRHSGSRVIMNFVSHVILQDQLIKALCDFMVRSHSR